MPEPTVKCRSCGAEIFWCRSEKTGSLCPIDAKPVPNGNVIVQTLESGERVAVYQNKNNLFERIAGGERFQSHYVSCPQANAWRKSKVKEP